MNSAMKESCRCWRADHGGVVRNRDVTSGLWSVSRRNCHPSSKNLKCLTALKAALCRRWSTWCPPPTASWNRTPAAAISRRSAVEARCRRVCLRRLWRGKARHSGLGAPVVPRPPGPPWPLRRLRRRPFQRLGGAPERICQRLQCAGDAWKEPPVKIHVGVTTM